MIIHWKLSQLVTCLRIGKRFAIHDKGTWQSGHSLMTATLNPPGPATGHRYLYGEAHGDGAWIFNAETG
jgi:hypothetical protein